MAEVIRIHEYGEPSVMRHETVELRPLGPAEVRLKQHAIGVNYVDTMVRDGRFKLPLPTVLGFEGAGVVEALGKDVKGFSLGDRVGYFFADGGYSSERVIPAEKLIHLPADVTSERAAAILAKGLTAWMALRVLFPVEAGQIVLIQGASGSVGSVLSRWAKLLGATVIGVSGSANKLEAVQAGADHAIVAGDPELVAKVKAIAPDGVNVVYDLVGDATFKQSVEAVRDGGKIITIGAASGQPTIDHAALSRRGIEALGGSTPQFVNASTIGRASSELFEAMRSEMFADLTITPYPMLEVIAVHEKIKNRSLNGLSILIP